MDEAESTRLYETRVERLQKLMTLKAPKGVIARECLLVAMAVLPEEKTSQGLATYLITDFGNKKGN